jgi:hypothetical protein
MTVSTKPFPYHDVYAMFSARHAESQFSPYGMQVEGKYKLSTSHDATVFKICH